MSLTIKGEILTNSQEVKRFFVQPAINKNATVNATINVENATVSPNDTIDKIYPSTLMILF